MNLIAAEVKSMLAQLRIARAAEAVFDGYTDSPATTLDPKFADAWNAAHDAVTSLEYQLGMYGVDYDAELR
jgi:hypothetical protein